MQVCAFKIVKDETNHLLIIFTDAYKVLENLSEKSFKFWGGPYLVYVVRDPDDLAIILKSDGCFEKHENYEKIGLPRGMFTVGGDLYRLHRKLLMPAFSLKSLQSYVPILNKYSQQFVDQMKNDLSDQEIEITDKISIFNLTSLLATLFGREDVPESMIKQYHEDNMK